MRHKRLALAAPVLLLLLAFVAACTSEATPSDEPSADSTSPGAATTAGAAFETSGFAARPSGVTLLSSGSAAGQSGIWVSGTGVVTVEPDLAILTVGVETRAETVEEARNEAAVAMTSVIASLRASGVAEAEIQTRFFNIFPEYTWRERIDDRGGRSSEQVLTGYRVSNQATAKLRDLATAGDVIDAVAKAGGDAVRIQGITFSVDDPSDLYVQAREIAVKSAMAKAAQFAELTDVTLGRLVYIAELGSAPVARADEFRLESLAATAPAATTPISSGELDVRVSIQAVFAIQ